MCGDELPPAFAGRPRSYCSVTCRQRAYRRRKSEAAATKTTEEDRGGAPGAGRAAGTRGRSASAEAIVVRVRFDDPAGPGDEPGAAVADPTGDWHSLDDLAHAALLLAHGLRSRQRAADAEAAGEAGNGQAGQRDTGAGRPAGEPSGAAITPSDRPGPDGAGAGEC